MSSQDNTITDISDNTIIDMSDNTIPDVPDNTMTDMSDNTIIDIPDNTITDIPDNTIPDNTIPDNTITDIPDNTIPGNTITDIPDNTITDIPDYTITDISDIEPPVPLPPVTLEDISNNTIFQMNITNIQVLPTPYIICDINQTSGVRLAPDLVVAPQGSPDQCTVLYDVVNLVNWQYIGNYRDKQIEITGSTQLGPPNIEDFVEYQKLSKEEVILWVIPQINTNDYQQNIIQQIYLQYFPPQTSAPLLPWI